jgi:hypothetical protein
MYRQRIWKNMALLAGFCLLTGCASVTFTPLEGETERTPKPDDFEVEVLSEHEGGDLITIGTVSCQDSGSSTIWNGWKDLQALIEEMKGYNLERLMRKIRAVGGDALIDLQHDVLTGGGGGGGVSLGVGAGSGGFGVGVGTRILSSNPKIIVVSHGKVGVYPEDT